MAARKGVTAAVAVAALAIGLSTGPALQAGAATSRTAPSVVAAQLAAAPAATDGVTIAVDPSYQQAEWQGWGTSLAWMAEVTGGYPDQVRNKLVDLVFGKDGLNLNIARYNIGGGNAPTVKDYLRPGGAVPGFWQAPATYGPTDTGWWDPNDPADWNAAADPNQRWWVDQIKKRVTHWEAFSNSPPYFDTVSGYVSGGLDSKADQIRADKVDEFAAYLVKAAKQLEDAHGITFDSIEPLNEPNTPYWGTTIGTGGQPTGGRQEGAHAGPQLQSQVVEALRRALTASGGKAAISAPDETNPGTFLTDWYGYPATGQAAVDQLNVHTYGTGQRTSARDLAKAEQRPLWMSEVEGSWGHDFTSMDSGLGMAQQIIGDLRELEPSAWVLWQPIEDAKNMVTEGNLQWGSIQVPFDCTATDTLTTCPIKTNTKFDTIRNFTRYIRPGDHMVKVNDPNSIAAIGHGGTRATVVHANSGTEPQAVTLDLSRFGDVSRAATVTPVVTSAAGKLKRGVPVLVSDRKATLKVPAGSVTTFLITGVSSVAANAAHLQAGHTYRIEGVGSGKSLTPGAPAVTIQDNDPAAAGQLWTLRAVSGAGTSRARYTVLDAATGQRLAVRAGNAVVEDAGAADEAAQWTVSTTGDGTYTLINVGARRLLDVPGGAVTAGTAIGVYLPNSGTNQRWVLRDETVARTETAQVYTVPNRTPVLPTTVTAVLQNGARRSLPVTWQLPAQSKWRTPGTVKVTGTAVDVLGRPVPATATVTVDVFTTSEAGRAKTFPGGQPDLPATVVGLGTHGGRADLPVTWAPPAAGAFDQLGVVTLTGTAQVLDGTAVPATVRVRVGAPAEERLGTDGVTVSASFTEPGYSTNALVNGDTTDKAWSNWKGSDRNASDTLTVHLPKTREVTRIVTDFYRDNSSGGGLAQSLRAGVPDATGQCVAGAEVPVGTASALAVSAPVAGGPGTAVCVVLTAVPNGYLTVAELEVYAKSPGIGSDATLAGLQVNGVPVAGFNPATTSYQVKTKHPDTAVVTATAADPYATVVVRSSGRKWTVTSTSEDGSQQATYRVTLAAS